jgi:hypothetical protein
MMKVFYLAFLIMWLTTNIASACSWGVPTLKRLNNSFASMVTSENNKFLLKMLPSSWGQKGRKYFKVKESIGTVYRLGKKGDFQYLWNAKNISPYEKKAYLPKSEYFTVLLSNDGKRAVKVKRYGSRYERNQNWLKNKDFVVIYDQGVISHQYSYFDAFKGLPNTLAMGCTGIVWVSKIKLEGNLLSLKSGLSNSKNPKVWSVDITSGKTAK